MEGSKPLDREALWAASNRLEAAEDLHGEGAEAVNAWLESHNIDGEEWAAFIAESLMQSVGPSAFANPLLPVIWGVAFQVGWTAALMYGGITEGGSE